MAVVEVLGGSGPGGVGLRAVMRWVLVPIPPTYPRLVDRGQAGWSVGGRFRRVLGRLCILLLTRGHDVGALLPGQLFPVDGVAGGLVATDPAALFQPRFGVIEPVPGVGERRRFSHRGLARGRGRSPGGRFRR